MRRLHVHVAVTDLERSRAFYTTMFNAEPVVVKGDYMKWLLDDPAVNFAISTRAGRNGVDHLGIQVDTDAEVEEIEARLAAAQEQVAPQRDAVCCYAAGNKSWARDPAGVPWETYHTMADVDVFGTDHQPLDDVAAKGEGSACCVPDAAFVTAATDEAPAKSGGSCCG